MKHITPERLVELSLIETPSGEEAGHLADCAICAEALGAEQTLSAALCTLPRPEPPIGFVAETCAACASAVSTRQRRFTALTLLASLLLGNLAAVFAVAMIVLNANAIAHGAALTLNQAVILLHALHATAGALPLLAWVSVITTCVAALGLSALVSRLAWATAEAK